MGMTISLSVFQVMGINEDKGSTYPPPVSCHPTVLVSCPEVWSGHETTTVYGIMLLVLPDETGSYLFTSPDLSLQFQPPEAAGIPVQRTASGETNSCSHLWQWHY